MAGRACMRKVMLKPPVAVVSDIGSVEPNRRQRESLGVVYAYCPEEATLLCKTSCFTTRRW